MPVRIAIGKRLHDRSPITAVRKPNIPKSHGTIQRVGLSHIFRGTDNPAIEHRASCISDVACGVQVCILASFFVHPPASDWRTLVNQCVRAAGTHFISQ
jgi:hypothetical protein